jgi:hypothetical protein
MKCSERCQALLGLCYEIVIELTSGLTVSTEPQQAEPESGRRLDRRTVLRKYA